MNKSFWKDVFSENGHASSKRILGGLIIIAVVTGWCIGLYHEGMSDNITRLGETLVTVSCVLLGISKAADAFIERKSTPKEEKKIEEEIEPEP